MKFIDMKIPTNNSAHSEQVQQALFKMGYRWHASNNAKCYHTDKGYLATDVFGVIRYGEGLKWFTINKKPQYYLKGSKLKLKENSNNFGLPSPIRAAPPMPKVKPPKAQLAFVPTTEDAVLKEDLELVSACVGVSPQKLIRQLVDKKIKELLNEYANSKGK